MASKHIKRSNEFYQRVLGVAQKLMGVHTKQDLKDAAQLLIDHTHDSVCMLKAKATEPIFTMIAHDAECSIAGLEAWIAKAEQLGKHVDKLDDARQCLKEFREYQS